MSKAPTCWQLSRYQDSIREVSAKRRQDALQTGSLFADYFETEAEAVAHLIDRAVADLSRAEGAVVVARSRLARLRKKHGVTP